MKKEIIPGILIGLLLFIVVSNFAKIKQIFQTNPEKETKITKLVSPAPTAAQLNPQLIDDITLENIQINGKEYDYELGNITNDKNQTVSENETQKVQRLVFFYLNNLEDPLFTGPDFNPQKFDLSVKSLEKAQKTLLKGLKREDSIFPISFLRTIKDCNDKNNAFFKNPSLESARELITSYKTTAMAYKNDSEKFVSKINKKENDLPNTNFVFINSAISKKTLLNNFNLIQKNGQKLEEEIKKRENCLEKGIDCQRPSEKFTENNSGFIRNKTSPYLPLDLLFNQNEDISSLRGPYITETSCWGSKEGSAMYIQSKKIDNVKEDGKILEIVYLKLATDNFYRKVGDMQVLDSELIKAGLKERAPQLETNFYACLDLDYQTQTTTTDSFLRQYSPLFTTIQLKDIPKEQLEFWQKAQVFEKEFFNASPPDFRNLKTLSDHYAFAYKILNKNPEIRKEFLKRHIFINSQLSQTESLLANAIVNLRFIYLINRKNPDYFRSDSRYFEFIYPFRSFWSLLYFPYSPSFWKVEAPKYLDRKITENGPTKEKSYLNYTESVKTYSKTEVKKWHTVYNNYLKGEAAFEY